MEKTIEEKDISCKIVNSKRKTEEVVGQITTKKQKIDQKMKDVKEKVENIGDNTNKITTTTTADGCKQSAANAAAVLQSGKVAVIAGCSTGIGLSMALNCASIGMKVVMADIDEAEGVNAFSKVVKKALNGKNDVLWVTTDVSNFKDMENLKNVAIEKFGGVHLLMNNAGIMISGDAISNYENWGKVIAVNLGGVINGCQVFANDMIAQDTPCVIINTGSKQGITTPPGNTAYNVSKAGVKVLTEGLQHTLREKDNCQVSAFLLVPGWTNTSIALNAKRSQDKNFDANKIFHENNPNPGAWMSQQVVDFCFMKMKQGYFYILCPDNETSWNIDQFRTQWTCDDIIKNRPPLSRWHPKYKEDFKKKCPSFIPN